MRTCFFDIETTNLKANFGVLLCTSIKSYGGKTVTFAWSPKYPEKRIIEDTIKELNRFDIIVSYYGRMFDMKFLKTRAEHFKVPFVNHQMRHIDLYFTIRGNYSFNSNRLATACEFFGIHGKTPLASQQWIDAITGDPNLKHSSMKYISEHNRQDVIILEKLFNVVKHNVRTVPIL